MSSLVAGTTNRDPYKGSDCYWVRDLSDAEAYLLKNALLDQRLEGRWFSRVLGDQFNRFKTWPMFFDSVETSGKELRDGFATVWSTFILAETLLATVAIRPFTTTVPLNGWRLQLYGSLWTVAMLSDFAGLTVTTIFLAFLHSVPAKLTYMWVCNIGAWIAIPIVLLVLGTLTSAIATSLSAWFLFGKGLGISCLLIQGLVVWFSIKASNSLAGASVATEALITKRETTAHDEASNNLAGASVATETTAHDEALNSPAGASTDDIGRLYPHV